MCAVSVIYGMFKPLPDSWYNQERIDLFRNMLTTAEIFDKESNQPDCADPDKEKLVEHIDELEKQIKEQE
jgi:hypothetical protein